MIGHNPEHIGACRLEWNAVGTAQWLRPERVAVLTADGLRAVTDCIFTADHCELTRNTFCCVRVVIGAQGILIVFAIGPRIVRHEGNTLPFNG